MPGCVFQLRDWSGSSTQMSIIVFWTAASLLVLTFGGYSLVIMLISVFFRDSVRQAAIEPSVTFLITAYNEQLHIGDKLAHTLSLDYPREKLQILVASDGSSDDTDRIVERFSAEGVRLIRVEGRRGKTAAQNEAVKHASGEIIIFSDATTHYSSNVIRKLVRNYADERVGAVGGRFHYSNNGGTAVGLGTVLFWKYETLLKSLLSRIWSIIGCSGCIYSIRSSLYVPLPPEIISDLCEPLKILEKGYRVVFEPDAIAFEETTTKAKQEFAMRVRVISRGMHGLLYMKSLFNPIRHPFLSVHLFFHKLLRWGFPLTMAAMFIANAFLLDRPFYLAIFVLSSLLIVAAATGAVMERNCSPPKVLGLPLYLATVGAASLVAMYRVIKGKRATVWETIRS